jgi:signal transduction histidine kinase
MAHIFDRFYQADASRDRGSGTSGLGLAITRAIIEAHGGNTGAENAPDGGARFWLDVPLAIPG